MLTETALTPDIAPASDYDRLPYPSAIFPQTHPDRSAVMAILFGMKPGRVEQCRVLELGCGDGSNLIAMACALPDSQFHGIDLASLPIRKGQKMIDALGLRNITLRQLDLLQAPSDLGHFDFIIAHGLYSWVPAAVREKILALCGTHLAGEGVAYVSYNAYPGNHFRDLVRKMAQYHAGHFPDPLQQIRQARALIKFLAESKPEPDVYSLVLKRELERIGKYEDAGFFHDDLSPINHPCYFHEFIEQAAKHGLQYLAEADAGDNSEARVPPHVLALVNELPKGDVIAREQYLDFFKGRAFRQTLLCRKGISLQREPKPERVRELFIASPAEPVSTNIDGASKAMEDFKGPQDTVIATGNPLIKSAILHLRKAWPASRHFPELLAAARADLAQLLNPRSNQIDRADQPFKSSGETDAEDLGDFILRTYPLSFVELHAHADRFVTEVSARPTASPLARLQLADGNTIATLRHNALRIEDALGRHLLRLLDGTRDRAALLRELGALVQAGAAAVCRDGEPIGDVPEALRVLADQLEANLNVLARSAVLAQ